MDFRHQPASPEALSTLDADALLLIVFADATQSPVDPAVAAALDDAVAQGDLQLKAGKCLYLHRPARFAASRVVLAVAASASAKALKSAVANAFGLVKGSGAKHIAFGAEWRQSAVCLL